MSGENKIVYGDYEITYTNNDIEVKDCGTGKIYYSKFKVFKVIEQLQNNWNELKEFIKENHWGNVSASILDKMQEIESRE